jgi:collagen type VII alpha
MPTFIKAGFWEKTCNPCTGYKGWLNLDQFVGQAGTSGTSGVNGPIGPQGVQGTQGIQGPSGVNGSSGTSGLSGDKYRTTSSTSFTLGTSTTLTIGTGLAYTPAQDVIITYDVNNHQICTVVSYNPGTGVLVIGPPVTVVGSGTYSSWIVNLNGAAGGDGSSGTSGVNGSSGTSGVNGLQGVQGLQGIAGSNGTSGSSGVSGTSGISGSSGSSGSSGTSPVFPLPLVYGLFSQTGNSTIITNTTVESTLINGGVGTLSVLANQFSVGDSFRGDFGGVVNTGNNQTIRIRLKTGSVILVDSGAQTINNVSNNVWSLSVNFTIRATGAAGVASIVSLGTFNYAKTVNGTVEGFSFNAVNNTTFDTTVNNTLNVTVEWGAASTSNSIYSDIFVLNKIY